MPVRIYHLWHPRARKGAVEDGTWEQNRALLARYRAAAGNAAVMRALRDEEPPSC
jgi:hypothetical protein